MYFFMKDKHGENEIKLIVRSEDEEGQWNGKE